MWTKPQPPQVPSGVTRAPSCKNSQVPWEGRPGWQRPGEQVTAVQCPVEVWAGGKQHKHRHTNFIPAEKLTTGKKRPSMLKFSNIPWTGCPLIRNEMLGALRSKQQLMTSSVLSRCWFGELTVLAIQPVRTRRKGTCVYLRGSPSELKAEVWAAVTYQCTTRE